MRLPLVFPSVFIISRSQGQIVRDFSDTAIAAADVESDTFNVMFDNSFENSGAEFSGGDEEEGIGALRRRKKKKSKKKKKNKQRQKKRQNRPKPVKKPTPPTSLFKGVDELISNIAEDYNYSAKGQDGEKSVFFLWCF